MSRIRQVTLSEFKLLITFAQKYHSSQNEPIPKMFPEQEDKITSCLLTPFQTFGGFHLYRGFPTKAAILFYLICKNHPLSNGNKRMACITFGYFCFKNGYELGLPEEEFYETAKAVTISSPEEKDRVLRILATIVKSVVRRKS